jgi:hypothetical protein
LRPIASECSGTITGDNSQQHYDQMTTIEKDGRIVTRTVSSVTQGAAPPVDLSSEKPREKIDKLLPGLFLIDFNSVGLMSLLASQLPWEDGAAGEVGLFHLRTHQVMQMKYVTNAENRRDGRKRWRIDGTAMKLSLSLLVRDDGMLEEWTLQDRQGNQLAYYLESDPTARASQMATPEGRLEQFGRMIRPLDW